MRHRHHSAFVPIAAGLVVYSAVSSQQSQRNLFNLLGWLALIFIAAFALLCIVGPFVLDATDVGFGVEACESHASTCVLPPSKWCGHSLFDQNDARCKGILR